MDSIAALGAIEIGPSVMPTRNALYPLLDAHADLIRSVDKRTFVYGEKRKRQIADVYYPPAGAGVGPGAGEGEGAPVLVFFYGGGLVIGDRNLPAPYDLIYSNLGSFFALRGIVTVIASYRLVRLDDGGIVAEGKKDEAGNQEEEEEESAVYPSGAQDCGLAIQWAHKALAPGGEAAKAWPGEGKADATKMFALGNSAGGLHLASFLFDPELMSQAQVKMGMEKPLRSAILLGVPFDFEDTTPDRQSVLRQYYNSNSNPSEWRTPRSLLSSLPSSSSPSTTPIPIPPLLTLYSKFDPPEILLPTQRFWADWVSKAGAGAGAGAAGAGAGAGAGVGAAAGAGAGVGALEEIQGPHNHISPPLSLSSGEGEEWGERVVRWVRAHCV